MGEIDAVTPLGSPVTASFTLPVKPYCGATEIPAEAVDPWPSITGLLLVRANVGTYTPRENVVVFLSDPEVPVIVTVPEASGAEADAVNVRVVDPVAGVGVNVAVTPLGSPEAVRLTS